MGKPSEGVEAVQLELACRAYMHEPERPTPENWPTPIDEKRAAPTRATIKRVLETMLEWVRIMKCDSDLFNVAVIPDGREVDDRESSACRPRPAASAGFPIDRAVGPSGMTSAKV